jgi:hypothetical protein
MTTTQSMTPAAQRALDTILNLRRLTRETGTQTIKTQNQVLRALDSNDLVSVANALAQ